MIQVRDDLIKLRARALWKKFKGNSLRPGTPEDEIILKEYVEGMRGVPTAGIDRTFDEASKSDRLPKAHDMKRFAPGHQTQHVGGSPATQSPFPRDFSDWLNEVACRAHIRFDKTGNTEYMRLYELADQAELPYGLKSHGSGRSTQELKRLFSEWADMSKVSQIIFQEVMT